MCRSLIHVQVIHANIQMPQGIASVHQVSGNVVSLLTPEFLITHTLNAQEEGNE